MKTSFKFTRLILLFFLIVFINSCKKDKPTPPVLTTNAITSISYTTAISGGNVTDQGSSPVLSRGICWSTSSEPTISDTKTIEGTGLVVFTSNLAQLLPNTLYYVRSYATNSAGTGYGNQVSFTTLQLSVPVLTTKLIGTVSQTTAVSGGNITDDNGSSVTARGVCWNTISNPTIANNKTSDGTGIGSFISNLIALQPGTTYYLKAYATNSVGTSYGNEINFTTQPTTIPVLTTTLLTAITKNSAIGGGNISSDGGATITNRGICWSKLPNPTILDSKTSDGTGTGSYSSTLTGLSLYTTYYVKAYATNSVGTAYGSEIGFNTLGLSIGDNYQGGKVAYILLFGDPGYNVSTQHGLIAAPTDQSSNIAWYNGSLISTGATFTTLGNGNFNTGLIVNSQGAGAYAAKLCFDLDLGGYNDWYLPCKDELMKLYLSKDIIGGFTSSDYWSSSESGAFDAWRQNFGLGNVFNYGKSALVSVRAIRSF
jgi:Protein of unknown function (DUF1566)